MHICGFSPNGLGQPRAVALIVPDKLNAESYRRILRVVEALDFVEVGANDGHLSQRDFAFAEAVLFVTEGVSMESAPDQEVAGVELGDQRLTKRLSIIVDRLGAQPNLSLPAAMHGRSEMEAAYRFFANEKVTPEAILRTHAAMTRPRISREQDCLLVQDTTEVVLTRPQQQVQGAGPLSCEAQRGAFVHPLLAFTTNGIPLGVVWQKHWARTELKTGMTPAEKRQETRATPIEDKESVRGMEGLREARQVADECQNTRCILVADSEADIDEVFSEPRETRHGRPLELLIRGCQDRATTQTGRHLLDGARATPCRDTATVPVSPRAAWTNVETRQRRTERPARVATVEVRACSVTLRPPHRPDRKRPEVEVHMVLVEEVGTPAGQEPLQGILATTLPLDTDELIRTIVEYDCHRWGIEVYFKTWKSGCRIEERQFEFLDHELNCIAVDRIVAWRVLLLCRLGRTCPDLSCEIAFEPSEWKAVYLVVTKPAPPKTPPRLNDMIRLIASLGGDVNRAKTEPGTQTLWFGLQRMHDFANCYDSFGPDSQKR